MELYILRHGLAGEPGDPAYKSDSERPLTPKGRRKLRDVAEAMKALEISFDLILSSPYARAKQTAEVVAEAFDADKKLELSETLMPGGTTRALIELLKGRAPGLGSVLLVGHEPYLSGLISLLVSGDAGFRVALKKGGLCRLEVESLRHGRCAELAWLLTPKQMALMA